MLELEDTLIDRYIVINVFQTVSLLTDLVATTDHW